MVIYFNNKPDKDTELTMYKAGELCVETEDPIAYVSGPVTVTDPHSCVTGEEIDENDPVYILLDTGAAGK